MKNLRKSAATFVLVAGCLVGIGANAKVLFDAGWYQSSQSATPTPIGSKLASPAGHCTTPSDPQCVAEFDENGDYVDGNLIFGTFQ
jgi:hypothetical protein